MIVRAIRLVVCWAMGHNLVGVDLPPGWSWQTCRMCGGRIRGFRRPGPHDPPPIAR